MGDRLPLKTVRTLFLPPYAILSLLALLLGGIALTYTHFQISQMGEGYKSPLLLADRLFDLCLATGMLAAAFCIGRRSAGLLSLSFANLAEELSISVMIGVGIVGLLVLCLGLAGLLLPLPIIVSMSLLIFLSRRQGVRLLEVIKEAIVAATATKAHVTLTILFASLFLILALRAMTPPHSPDEVIYHLSVTKLFVQQGRVFPVIDNYDGNMPFLIHMMYAVFLMAKAEIAAKLFSLCLAVICSLALYAFSERFLTRRAGIVALFGFFAAGAIVEVSVTALIDVSLAGMIFLATYAMMVSFQTDRVQWLYASAILSGFSLGIKYTAAIYIVLLGIMFLVESFLRGQLRILAVIKRGAVYVAIVSAVASPWYVKNLVWFRNPVYPYITGEVAEFIPGQPRYFNAEDQVKLDAHFENARTQMPDLVRERKSELDKAASKREERHPLRVWEYFTRPAVYNMGDHSHYPNYLFLFCPLIVLATRSRWLIWLSALSMAFFLAVTNTSWLARLLIPVFPALTLISAYVITELAARADWGGSRQPRILKANWLPAIAVAFTLGSTALSSFKQVISTNDLAFVKGDVSRSEYMMTYFFYPPSHFINNSLPRESKVMMIGAETSYDLQRDYIADVNWDSTEWRRLLIRNSSMQALNEDLKRRGITHFWVAYGLFPFVAEIGRENYPNLSGIVPKTGPDYQPQLVNWATLDMYSSTFLEPVYSDKFGNIVYQVK
ncbi:MAG: glycosyltransferase family 39 protein [Acidobacteriota bacterium]